MARPNLRLLVPVLFLVFSSQMCNFPRSTPAIVEAWMARDYFGEQSTSSFSPEDVFYCIAKLESPADGSAVQAVWTIVSSKGIAQDQVIDQVEISTESGTIHFELSNAGPWPEGAYKVDLYLNGALDRSLEFTVQ